VLLAGDCSSALPTLAVRDEPWVEAEDPKALQYELEEAEVEANDPTPLQYELATTSPDREFRLAKELRPSSASLQFELATASLAREDCLANELRPSSAVPFATITLGESGS